MSIVALLLKWTGLPQWAMEIMVVLAISGGLLASYAIWHHTVYQDGIAAQQQADTKASAAVLQKADADNAALLAKQIAANAQLEKTNATLQFSNRALADSFAGGLRNAFAAGSHSAMSAAPPTPRSAPPAPTSGSVDGTVVQDITQVLAACAADDATLSELQSYVSDELALFHSSETPHVLTPSHAQ